MQATGRSPRTRTSNGTRPRRPVVFESAIHAFQRLLDSIRHPFLIAFRHIIPRDIVNDSVTEGIFLIACVITILSAGRKDSIEACDISRQILSKKLEKNQGVNRRNEWVKTRDSR
jgi:hypothetical protein